MEVCMLSPRLTFAALALAVSAQAAEPTPTPTRPPRTLSEAAARVTLDRSLLEDPGATIVVSDANLEKLAARGGLTTCTPFTSSRHEGTGKSPGSGDEAVRSRWRARYRSQARAIAVLENTASALRSEVQRLDLNDNDARRLARLESALEKLRTVESRLALEERRLHRIVQHARQEGAQPGWFRDLR
jgi:hypothetical protein